jgi:integrase
MLTDIDKPVARALRWTILTAARTSETLGATWAEINGDTWTVPANRIKAGREHRVPLTDAMRACLGPRGADGDKVLGLIGAMEMQRLLKRYHDYTVHGFRSAFVTWAQEKGYPFELREIALAHRVGDATAQAYNRGDQKHLRLELMQAWSNYVTGTTAA